MANTDAAPCRWRAQTPNSERSPARAGWSSTRRRAIAAEWGASENNRRAKFYTLTRAGRRLLAREERSWEDTTAILARFLAPERAE